MFKREQPANSYEKRQEIAFLIFSGLFIGSLTMLNILGITKLIDLSFTIFSVEVPFRVFIGVLPYPLTFLCTDFISEFFGKKRATYVVWVGFLLNVWVVFILWVGGVLPPVPEMQADGLPATDNQYRAFYEVRQLAFGATAASMLAYLTAQFVDVHVFHFIRNKTKGKLLWLRNNGSTLTSQLVDSLAVVLITYYFTHAIVVPPEFSVSEFLLILIVSNYVFKLIAALVDTIPFYLGVKYLAPYLGIELYKEFEEN
jgi:uncharacterized integral membrane protein (TIGR00697 family)